MRRIRSLVIAGIIVSILCVVSVFSGCQDESQSVVEKIEAKLKPKPYITYQDGLYAIDFIDAQFGWTVGSWGAIFSTEDGGKNWSRQDSNTDNYLYSVSFVDRLNGWIVGGYGIILRTKDGGKTWAPQQSSTQKHLYKVKFINKSEGWVVGYWGVILYTRDGGENWLDKSIDEDIAFSSLSLVGKHCWIVGEFGTIFYTNNNGENWKKQVSGVGENIFLYGVDFSSAEEGWAVGLGGTVLRTQNGGKEWRLVAQGSGFKDTLFDVVLRDKHLFAVGERGAIIEIIETPGEDGPFPIQKIVPAPVTYVSLSSLCLADKRVWIVGRYGTIFMLEG